MDNNDNNDRFWSMICDYGMGVLVVQTDGLRSRPILPVINRPLGEIVCIVDKSWMGQSTFDVPCVLSFLSEHTYKSLTLRGTGRGSSGEDDISVAWNCLSDRLYPDGRKSVGLLALRIVPQCADLWQIGQREPHSHWQLESGSFKRRLDAH